MNSETTYLTDLAAVLWPCGGLLGPGDGGVRRLVRQERGNQYLPVPSARSPRVILPAHDRSAALRGIASFCRGHSFAERARAALLTGAFATGLAPLLLRDRLYVGAGPGIEHALTSALDRRLAIAIHLGPPRANRKPVLLLLTPGGRTIGYAKVAVNDLTSRLVRAETRALRHLTDARLRDVTVPRLLYEGEWNGHPLLVQEALPVGDQTDRPTRRQLLRCVTQIVELTSVRERRLADSPYRTSLEERIVALGSRPEAAPLRAALRRLPDVTIPFGAWHGDLTRWNIASTARRAFVWDWERLALDAPVGFDALHYDLNECVQAGVHPGVHRWLDSGSRLLRDPLIAETGLRPHAVSTVMALYLIDLATRYLHDRQDESGGHLASVDDWLLPALEGLQERATHEAAHTG
ncbi:aminoglycoside phosphotransferase [Nocardiopsis sp. CNR-923]|uniref:phosphotransferase n=1 Tax=Nocardiopsis sp. CNR-923 TaxID=1904965 RepID=UPI00095ACA47|nr:phosphotransferase [Nocardiopsis sp. CNR-923]OLT25530.1 aminoglycoside phosphotransferase [Nocardiopsis sp. CNR-923]